MIAYKFLRPDGSGVFTRYAWPLPDGGPGAWVEAPVVACRSGVHACRAEDLPLWLGEDLYEIELGGQIVAERMKVVAARGRLLRRIGAWDDAARAAYTRGLRRARPRARRAPAGLGRRRRARERGRPGRDRLHRGAHRGGARRPGGLPRRARAPGRLALRAARVVTNRRPGRLRGVEDLPCQELVELVTDYLEGALPPGERARFDAHVAECPGCTEYLEQMRATLALTRASRELEGRPEVDGLLRAFRDWHRA